MLSAVLSAGDELEAQEMLESLSQLADVSPLFFRTNVVSYTSPDDLRFASNLLDNFPGEKTFCQYRERCTVDKNGGLA